MPINQIDPNKSALILIDLQNGVLQMPVAPHSAADVLAKAVSISEAFRNAGALVVLVRVESKPGEAITAIVDQPRAANSNLPHDWAQIASELGPKESDVLITKKNWGAFYGTDLDLQLRRRGIDTIVLGGIATNMGVESTARSAHEHNYNVIFIDDAISGLSAEDHAFALNRIFPRIGRVSSTKEIIDLLS
jgi:nicotinamidase-related amidase